MIGRGIAYSNEDSGRGDSFNESLPRRCAVKLTAQ
jgi:hypothetical protein